MGHKSDALGLCAVFRFFRVSRMCARIAGGRHGFALRVLAGGLLTLHLEQPDQLGRAGSAPEADQR